MNLKLLIIRCCWVLLLYCFPLINYAQTDCVCAEIYAPVCAAGVTYSNACEAECNGVFDYVDGICDAVVDSVNIGVVDVPPFDSIFIGVPDTLFYTTTGGGDSIIFIPVVDISPADDSITTATCQVCDVSDPIAELGWLTAFTAQECVAAIDAIIQNDGSYYFYINNSNCPAATSYVYDCNGNQICAFSDDILHNNDGEAVCKYFWDNISCQTTIWTPPAVEPCACPAVYDPVCANGITYGNACEAECAGVFSYVAGSCPVPPPFVATCDSAVNPLDFPWLQNVINTSPCVQEVHQADYQGNTIYYIVSGNGNFCPIDYPNMIIYDCEGNELCALGGYPMYPPVINPYCDGFIAGKTNDVLLWSNSNPCFCTDFYAPVCANGVTYNNACEAQCVGVFDYIFGACNTESNCLDLAGLDFGVCDMALGVAYVGGQCVSVSGCDWSIDGTDYSQYFYSSFEACETLCMGIAPPPASDTLVYNICAGDSILIGLEGMLGNALPAWNPSESLNCVNNCFAAWVAPSQSTLYTLTVFTTIGMTTDYFYYQVNINPDCGNNNDCTYATSGTVVDYTGLDGCGLVIQLADGSVLEPVSAPFGLNLTAGMTLNFDYSLAADAASSCMAGLLVNITCYQVVNPDGDCICPAIYAPVCGGNGITYSNACEAECNGVFVYVEGECNINPANCTLIYGASDLPWLASAIGNIDTDCACGYSLQQYCYNEQTYFVLAPNPDAPCADVQTLIFDGNGTLVCTDGGIAGGNCFEILPDFYTTALALGAPLWNCGDCLYNQFGTIVEVNTPCFSGMAIVLTDGSYIYNSNISDFGFAVGDVIKFSSSVPEQNPMVCPDNGEYMVYYAINCAAPAECYESALAIQYQNILCPDVYEPVCGCNGVTYPNTCAATANGITSWSIGECSPIPSDCNGCNTENPLTDLPWLAALTQQQCIGSITMITHSSGQSYFYTGGGFPCTDVPSYLYDCQGNQLCGFGGLIIWENNDSICNTLWENIICEEIIWTAPPPCFCEEFGYAPVCANGITYINACEAECSGVFDYVVGECNIIPNDTTYIYGSICLNDSTAVMFSDMLGSFGDEEGVALTLAPQNGTVSFTGQPWEQSFTYIPNSGFLGTDTFVFAATGIQITADGSFQEYTIYIRKYTVEVLADCNIGCVCPAIYAPVCADGITYGNACEAQCAGVYDYTNGECGSDTTVIACQVCNVQNPLAELDWLSGFVGQECLNSITAITHANGQSYFYISNGFPCLDAPSYVYDCQGNAVCGFGGLIIWEENDTAFCDNFWQNIICQEVIWQAAPPCVCPDLYAPVCADGITYGNACEAQCAGVFNYTEGACEVNPPVVADCGEIDNPLQLDWLQNIITNAQGYCLLSIHQVTYEGSTLYYTLNGGNSCPIADYPYMTLYDCEGNILCSYGGFIVPFPPANPYCDNFANAMTNDIVLWESANNCFCLDIYAPVCADGITYGNACEAQCAGVFNYTEGACEDVTNNCDCPNTYAPVCSNGITYTNACEAECAGVINYENGACISICDLGSFTYTVNADGSYCFNENVALDNDVCAWTWNFGDGQSSNEMNPCNILLTPQADATVTPFTVCLTLSDCNQVEIGTCCQVIEVYNYNAVIFASACADLSNVDFGDCEAFLGYGMINNQCTGISGCSTFVNGVDYINAIYSDADMCQTACVTGGNENPNTDGSSGDTFTTLCIPTGGSAELCPMISIINQESIASYTCAYDNCAASAVSDDYCVNYQALAQTYQDTVYIQICNPNNECRTATYYITVGNDCPACTDEISVCTEAMTPLVLCPEFCDLSSDDDLEITFIQSFYTACSVHLLPENCLRYTPIPGFETYDVEDFLKVVACNAAGECDTVLYHIQVGGCDTFEAMPAFAENNDGGGAINEFGVIQLPADNDHKSGFNIYPNPARDNVHIPLQMNNAAKQNISIQDLNGKLIAVYHIESDNTNPYLQMNTNGFAPGVYLVKWNNGTQQIVQKLLIEP